MPKLTILGTGWGTRVQADAFRAAGWTLHAVWGRSAERVATARAEHGFAHAPASWRDAFPGADLVSITTPPFEHREQAVAALAANANVLCEKPTALDAAEAREMLDAARASRGRALIDHELRFVPARQRMRELVRDGFIGEVRSVEARFAGDSRADPFKPFTWWSERARGGGVLGAIGSHVIDGLRFVLDADVTVTAATLSVMIPERTDAFGTVRRVDADDYASLLVDVRSLGGTTAPGAIVLNASARQALADVLILRGSEGTLVLRGNLKLEGARGRDRVLADLTPVVPEDVPLAFRTDPWKLGTFLLARHLRDVIERGAPLVDAATFEDGLRVQEALDDARRLARWT